MENNSMSIRPSVSLRKRIKYLAERDGVSVNQFVLSTLAEKVAVMEAMEYLEERASHADRNKFLASLDKALDVPESK